MHAISVWITQCVRDDARVRDRTQEGNSEPSQASPRARMFGVSGPRGTFCVPTLWVSAASFPAIVVSAVVVSADIRRGKP